MGEPLKGMLAKIETQYGQAERTWLMDRGIPTEEVLAEMRASTPPVRYLVGTPKGRLSKLEKDLAAQPWQEARPGPAPAGSNSCRRRASSTSSRKAKRASPKNAPCAGAG